MMTLKRTEIEEAEEVDDTGGKTDGGPTRMGDIEMTSTLRLENPKEIMKESTEPDDNEHTDYELSTMEKGGKETR